MQEATLTQPDRTVRVQGRRVAVYERGGAGPQLLFLHGSPDHGQVFLPLMQLLADRARCVAVDLPGYGYSEFLGRGCYRNERLTEWFSELDEVLPLRDTILVVTDIGGMFAIPWAIDRPDRIAALVVLNTTFWPEDDHPPKVLLPFMWPGIRHLLLPLQKVLLRRSLFAVQLKALFSREPRLPPQRLEFFWHQFEHGETKKAYYDWLYYFRKNQVWLRAQQPTLQQFDRPVQIIWGTKDPIFAEASVERFGEQWPQARSAVLIDASHYPQYEAVDEVADAMRGFLGALGH